MSKAIIEAIAVTAELTGTELSKAALVAMEADLSAYTEQSVLDALTRCRRELTGRLTLAAVLSRIDDGRPGAEEAWAMAPKTEAESAVWTREMAQAWGVAIDLYNAGDKVGARMAFKETYERLCTEARNNRVPVRWEPTLGQDVEGREAVLLKAVEQGRLTADHAERLLPYHRVTDETMRLLQEAEKRLMLEHKRAA